jgi:hypothetical protein
VLVRMNDLVKASSQFIIATPYPHPFGLSGSQYLWLRVRGDSGDGLCGHGAVPSDA